MSHWDGQSPAGPSGFETQAQNGQRRRLAQTPSGRAHPVRLRPQEVVYRVFPTSSGAFCSLFPCSRESNRSSVRAMRGGLSPVPTCAQSGEESRCNAAWDEPQRLVGLRGTASRVKGHTPVNVYSVNRRERKAARDIGNISSLRLAVDRLATDRAFLLSIHRRRCHQCPRLNQCRRDGSR